MNDDSLQKILHVLADGEFHSGQELGDILGVSRTAVWKHLQKLDALDVVLESVKGKGYRLHGGLDLLNAEHIRGALTPHARTLLSRLDIHAVIDSTNTYSMQHGAQVGSGYVCLAEQQTAGKGRRGRQWISPFGKNIYLSILWNFDGAAALEGLSLAVGVAIAEALVQCGVPDVQLKWPNDLLWKQRKLAGILLEMSGDPAGVCQVVVGIGINVSMPSASGDEIDQPWVDIDTILAESASSVSRNHLVATLLMHLLPLLQGYANHKFSAYRERWEALNANTAQMIELHTAKSIVLGRMLGVNDAGALRLQTEKGEELFYGGEVSLRATS